MCEKANPTHGVYKSANKKEIRTLDSPTGGPGTLSPIPLPLPLHVANLCPHTAGGADLCSSPTGNWVVMGRQLVKSKEVVPG